MITQISYNVLIERFKAFASGHFLIKGFTHGDPSNVNIEQGVEFPWMHVFPVEVEPRAGSRLYSFIITFADLPRDKETPPEYQREVLSDCIKLAEDLLAEIQNGLIVFGPTVELEGTSNIEVFINEYSHTLTGVNLALTLSVPWNWSACDIPADWSVGGTGSGGSGVGVGLVLRVNGVDNISQDVLNLIDGTNLTITDLGNGQVQFDASGGVGTINWGDIIGTLTNQTDLNTALGLKANSADLGAVAFSNDYNDLDNLPTIPTLTSELTNDSGFITIGDVPTQVQSNWTQSDNSQLDFIKNKPTLATVATSGSYTDLINTPSIPAAQVNSDWNAVSGLAQILNKPSVGAGSVTSVALTVPTAFSVTGSPITSSGTLAITGAGTTLEYIRGNGTLATTPTALPPNGSASGDLQGTYPAPTVHRIHGVDMQSGTPTADDTWVYGGSPAKWQHQKLHSNQVTNDSTVTGANVDNALSALNSGKQATLVSGTNIKTINSTTLLGSGNITTGTVTSVAALTLGTTGTDLTSTVATGSTTPVITLNVPTASATNRGALSAADWSTFNGKQAAITGGATTILSSDLSATKALVSDASGKVAASSSVVGYNLATLTDPTAISYLRINANNSVSALTLAQLKTDLGISTQVSNVITSVDVISGGALVWSDITGLSFAVTAGKSYRWRASFAAVALSTVAFSINGPSSPTYNTYRFIGSNAAATIAIFNGVTYDGTTVAAMSSNAMVTADGFFKPLISGTIILRMRSTTANTCTVRAGAILEFQEVL